MRVVLPIRITVTIGASVEAEKVVGGIGTKHHFSTRGTIPVAIELHAGSQSPIANAITAESKDFEIGELQAIRNELHGFSRRPGSLVFTRQTIDPDWAVHHGGRSQPWCIRSQWLHEQDTAGNGIRDDTRCRVPKIAPRLLTSVLLAPSSLSIKDVTLASVDASVTSASDEVDVRCGSIWEVSIWDLIVLIAEGFDRSRGLRANKIGARAQESIVRR